MEIFLLTRPDQSRYVTCDDVEIDGLPAMIARLRGVTDANELREGCRAINYLAHGFQYRPIDDIGAFSRRYQSQYKADQEAQTWEDDLAQLPDFGEFDLAELHPPHVEGDVLTFFVEDDYHGLPFRVSVPLSPGAAIPEPLPYQPARQLPSV